MIMVVQNKRDTEKYIKNKSYKALTTKHCPKCKSEDIEYGYKVESESWARQYVCFKCDYEWESL